MSTWVLSATAHKLPDAPWPAVRFLRPGAIRMHLHWSRVQRDGFDLDAHDLLQLKLLEDPVHHTAFRPAVHASVDGVPVAEPLKQTAPLAAMLGYIQ